MNTRFVGVRMSIVVPTRGYIQASGLPAGGTGAGRSGSQGCVSRHPLRSAIRGNVHRGFIHVDRCVEVAGRDSETMRASAKAPTQSPRRLHLNPARSQVIGSVVLESIVNWGPVHGSAAERSFVDIIFAGCVDGSHISRVGQRSGNAQQLVLRIGACVAVRISYDGPIAAVEPAYLASPYWIVGSVAIHAT